MKVTRIECEREGCEEVYYEPAAPRDALSVLRARGWHVRTRRVDVESEAARWASRASRFHREAASMAGASSLTVGASLVAGLAERYASAVRAAAQGRGSLITADAAEGGAA